jgi:hypothetical protein
MGKISVQELNQSISDTRTHMIVQTDSRANAELMIYRWEYIVLMGCSDDAQGVLRRSHLSTLERLILRNRKRYYH